jgi:hypothetical protein
MYTYTLSDPIYYDDRVDRQRFIRLVLLAKSKHSMGTDLWCHFRLRTASFAHALGTTVSSQARLYKTCENHAKIFSAYVASCLIPGNTTTKVITHSIALTTSEKVANPDFKFRVIHSKGLANTHAQMNFTVCVPPLFGDISALGLAEFIEMTQLLGADHFTFYMYNVSQNIVDLLDIYERSNTVTLLPWPLPEMDIWNYGQSSAVWDCLFRNMYRSNKIAFNDIDEYIVPHIGHT